MSTDANDITALRAHLFEAIRAVKAGTLAIDQARTINELCKTAIDTGKLEVDHIRVTGEQRESAFVAPALEAPQGGNTGLAGVRRHLLKG